MVLRRNFRRVRKLHMSELRAKLLELAGCLWGSHRCTHDRVWMLFLPHGTLILEQLHPQHEQAGEIPRLLDFSEVLHCPVCAQSLHWIRAICFFVSGA